MTKHFGSFSEVVNRLDDLQIGDKVKIGGKPAMVVESISGKVIRFTSNPVPAHKYAPMCYAKDVLFKGS